MKKCVSLLLLSWIVVALVVSKESKASDTVEEAQAYSSAPNDFVIQQIKRLHKAPYKVKEELETALLNNPSLSRRAELYYLLSVIHTKLAEYAEAENNIKAGLSHASPFQFPLTFYRLLLGKAQLLQLQGRPAEALGLTDRVASWATKQNIHQLHIGALMVGGLVDWRVGFYKSALQKLNVAYDLSNQQQTNVSPSHIAGLIGQVLISQDEGETALPYIEEWLEFARNTNNKLLQTRVLNAHGKALALAGQFENSNDSLQAAKQLSLELNDQHAIGLIDYELALLAFKQNQFDSAEQILSEVLNNPSVAEDAFLTFDANQQLAKVNFARNDIARAESLVNAACNIAVEVNDDTLKINCAGLQEQLYYKQGRFKDAYLQLQKHISLKEKRQTELNSIAVTALREQFSSAHKEAEVERLRQENELQRKQLAIEQKTRVITILVALFFIYTSVLLFLLHIKRRKYLQELEKSNNTDNLTQLDSRRFILEKLDELVPESYSGSKLSPKPLSIAMLDLDFFKSINDRFGHNTGDEVLIGFGQLAIQEFGHVASLGRLGGEEFLFLFPNTSLEQARQSLNDFREKVMTLSDDIDVLRGQHPVTVSIGLLEVRTTECRTRLLSVADEALFEAKNRGRNCIVATRLGSAQQSSQQRFSLDVSQ